MMLYEALSQYGGLDMCPMHMPGHKRNTMLLGDELPYRLDITEINGFDQLHEASGILKELADLAGELYGSRRSFLLVNGSTGGILSGIRALTARGDTILMARNCHQSVFHAVELCGLRPVYLMPPTDRNSGICGAIRPEQVACALEEHPEARLLVVTSPTYEGVVSDIRSISALAHARGIPLLVDEAHGAHLGFSRSFPESALHCGADLVVGSLHKTLPTLTQCALAHVGGDLVDPEKLARQLSIFETSSPSYVLMASIDRCLNLLRTHGGELFRAYENNLRGFEGQISRLDRLKVLCRGNDDMGNHPVFFRFDPGKLIIFAGETSYTGRELAELLRSRFRIEPEMACTDYVVCMTSICDSSENLNRLADALLALDRDASAPFAREGRPGAYPLPKKKLPLCDAVNVAGAYRSFRKALGAMVLEYIWAYPPGVPLVVPGEILDKELLRYLEGLLASGVELHGSGGRMPGQIYAEPWERLPASVDKHTAI